MTSDTDLQHIPAPTDPMAVARHLAPQWQHDGTPTLRHWRGTWMSWQDSHWRELDDQELRAWLYTHLEHATYLHTTPKGGAEERKWAPTIRKVADLNQAIAAVTHLSPSTDPPAWTGPSPATGHDHGPVVACTNG